MLNEGVLAYLSQMVYLSLMVISRILGSVGDISRPGISIVDLIILFVYR